MHIWTTSCARIRRGFDHQPKRGFFHHDATDLKQDGRQETGNFALRDSEPRDPAPIVSGCGKFMETGVGEVLGRSN
jgi:hypothetical protein